jgi:hypothetical protein
MSAMLINMISMKPKILYLLALSLSLIIISCKKSEMLVDPPSTNGISIKFYNYENIFIEKFNLNTVSSIKLNEMPSFNLKTTYMHLSFHPVTKSKAISDAQVFFLIKDNVTNEIVPYSVFLNSYYDYNWYGIRLKAAYNDSSIFNATVYSFLVKNLNSAISDTINFEIIHDGVIATIPIIPDKNTMEILPSIFINKNLIDNNEAHRIYYKLCSNDYENLGFIVNAGTYNNLTYWGIQYLNPESFLDGEFTCPDQMKLYAFKLIY